MKYRLGWKYKDKWHYKLFATEEDLLEELADTMLWADKISISPINHITLKG